ncbi:MAG: AEC family transporter, partial [Proteobacteria bacterium]|nr:AEC family transporter [Pseudomonadota bacterium]
ADLRGFLGTAAVVTLVKLVVMPAVVYGIAVWCGLGPTGTVAAVVCAAVPTAKTAYMLAGAYRTEEPLVASAISLTTLLSIVTLLVWLAVLL